jgi:hypothetical protein
MNPAFRWWHQDAPNSLHCARFMLSIPSARLYCASINESSALSGYSPALVSALFPAMSVRV